MKIHQKQPHQKTIMGALLPPKEVILLAILLQIFPILKNHSEQNSRVIGEKSFPIFSQSAL